MMLTRRYVVKGKVQGVFYRAETVKKAKKIGLTGWVKNLSNGDVETLACGIEEQLTEFENWLWRGPLLAKVTEVKVFIVEEEKEYQDFVILHDN